MYRGKTTRSHLVLEGKGYQAGDIFETDKKKYFLDCIRRGFVEPLEEPLPQEPLPEPQEEPPRGSILTRAKLALEEDDYNTAAKIVNAHVLPDDAPYMRIKSEVMDTLSKWVKSQEERD